MVHTESIRKQCVTWVYHIGSYRNNHEVQRARDYCVSEEKRTGFKISSNGAMHVPRFTVTVRHSKEMNPGLKLEHMFIRSQKLQVRIRCVYHEINTCEPQ